MTEKQIKKSAILTLHIIAACWVWKHVSPATSDYNSLPILAAVVFGGSLFYLFFEYMKDSPSHKEPEPPQLWQGKPSYFFREYKEEDSMQPPRPWPKPTPPPKTDWELYLEDAFSEMAFSDFYEKWRERIPRRPKGQPK